MGTFYHADCQSFGVVSKAEAGRQGDSAQVFLTLNPDMMTVASEEVLTIMPRLVAGGDSVELPAIHVLGRNTYYRYIRHDNLGLILPTDLVIWEKRRYRPFAYLKSAPWQPWMDRASLKLQILLTDCGQTDISTQSTVQQAKGQLSVGQPMPTTAAVAMRPGVITNRMTIIFPLNKTELHPELYNNQQELDKIRQSLETVQNTPGSELKSLTIKGYASPEGPYKNNQRLARGRTDSIGAFVSRHYQVDSAKVHTEYEPEDWEGLIKFIDEATAEQLPHRAQLLHIARRPDMKPDQKERIMRRTYPQDFSYLLEHCLPMLRHTDYRIDYQLNPQSPPAATHAVAVKDTVWQMPPVSRQHQPVYEPPRPFKALFALKTNALFDLALAFNGEIEVPIGDRFSLMGEFWKPWYVWHANSRAYQLQVLGAEVRYWFGPCRHRKPRLTGLFVAPYVAIGKYDFEWDTDNRHLADNYNGVGDQGEFNSIGATIGYAWPIHRHWNLEISASVGHLWGPRRHYHGEFGDTHLIWKYTTTSTYTGPTKLKVSLAWLIDKKRKEVRP